MANNFLFNKSIIIPGAPKSGTTNLCYTLIQQPGICEPRLKEPHFFSFSDKTINNNFEWYINLFKQTRSNGAVPIDASTSYLYSKKVISNIKRHIYDPRIIIILRDPAKRIFSNYQHMRRKVPRSLDNRCFDHIIDNIRGGGKQEIRKSENDLVSKSIKKRSVKYNYNDKDYLKNHFNEPIMSDFYDKMFTYKYFQNSIYSENVEMYIRSFGKENVKVIFFEEYKNDQDRILKELCDFIGIEYVHDIDFSTNRYSTKVPKNGFYRIIWYLRTKGLISGSLIKVFRLLGLYYIISSFKNTMFHKPKIEKYQYDKIRSQLSFEYEYWLEKYPQLKDLWRF